jgi:hypothetical protein
VRPGGIFGSAKGNAADWCGRAKPMLDDECDSEAVGKMQGHRHRGWTSHPEIETCLLTPSWKMFRDVPVVRRKRRRNQWPWRRELQAWIHKHLVWEAKRKREDRLEGGAKKGFL